MSFRLFSFRPATVVALVAAVALGAPAAAEESLVLDLSACVERVLSLSDALRAQEARYAAQSARLDAASDRRLPTLSASGSYTRSSEVESGHLTVLGNPVDLPAPLQNSTALRLQLQQTVYAGGRISAGVRAAEAAVRSAAAQRVAARAAAAGAAEKAYWNLYLAQEGEAAALENLRAMEAHGRDASRRLAQGAATRSETLAWELRTVQAELAVSGARTRREQAAAALALLLGLPWDAPVKTAIPPDPESDTQAAYVGSAAMDAVLRDVRSARADLADAEAQADGLDAALAQARGSLLPSVFLTGAFAYANPNPKVFPQRNEFESYWEVGVLATFDIGGVPGNLARVREAEENARAAHLRARSLLRSAELEVVSTAIAAQDARRRMEVAAKAVDLAEENVRVSTDRYNSGLTLDSELADAEAALLSARLERVGARVAWELARAALRDAAGGSAEDAEGARP